MKYNFILNSKPLFCSTLLAKHKKETLHRLWTFYEYNWLNWDIWIKIESITTKNLGIYSKLEDLKILTCFASKTRFNFIMFMKYADGFSEHNKYHMKEVTLRFGMFVF